MAIRDNIGLTQDLIKRLTSYYGLALRSNTDVEDMKKALVQAPCSRGKPQPPHTYNLPNKVVEALWPVYQRLSDPQLQARCSGNKTQNAAESLHLVIWSLISKQQHASLFIVEVAVHEAVASSGERSNGPGNSGDEGKCSAVPEHRGTRTSSAPQGLSERPTAVEEKEPRGDPTPRYNLRPRAKKSQQATTSMPQNKTASVLLEEKRTVAAAGVSRLKGEHVASSSRRGRKRQRQQSPSSSSSVCFRTEEGPKLPPPISRDLWTTTGPKKLPKLDSRAENQALSNSAMSKEAPSTSCPSLKTSTVPMFERHGEEPFQPPKARRLSGRSCYMRKRHQTYERSKSSACTKKKCDDGENNVWNSSVVQQPAWRSLDQNPADTMRWKKLSPILLENRGKRECP
ncbi:hypothetical protein HPB52_014465 [Rhipicephalus sanguineus]|uniref:Uncharacterized protein n=1 Tax=Rhipicephalus sanguineus TaxID=34632 RepID=A0A9D4QDW6_RHISA|nr:hypothetical protein HPB52_014465 [Rhipicephalus sanguineus]